MYRLLTTLTPDQLGERLGAARVAALPSMLQPRFLTLSAAYLADNAHLFERAGHRLARVHAQYTCFHDDDGEARYLPGLRVRARGLDLELVPAPDLDAACVPPGGRRALLDEVQAKICGNHWLWFARNRPGWDLGRSRFARFGDCSDEERAQMVREPLAVEIVEATLDGAAGARFEALRAQALAHKQQAGLALIARDHARLARAYPEALRLGLARVQGQEVAAMLWTEHGAEAALVEWVGDAVFRRDAVAPQVVLAFFDWLHARGVRRLEAARYEWFLPPIWERVMALDARDPDKARLHRATWQHLQARGLGELTP